MKTIKESIIEAIKTVDDMIEGSHGDALKMAQLKMMKWHLTRTLTTMEHFESLFGKDRSKTR